jgi:molybdenum cofactor biosynthesis protein B
MSTTEHTHQSRDTTVPTHVVVVTTSRTASTDKTGPAMVERLTAAGHPCTGPQRVPDDASTIGHALDAAIADTTIRCVLLCGGTGPSPTDVTADVIATRMTRHLPGFGELFRMLSFQEIGAAALLSRATGGIAGDTLVFALPGSPAAGGLALDQLILPSLAHLLHQLDRDDTVAEVAAEPEPTGGLTITTIGQGEPPTPDDPPAASGWQAALMAMGGQLIDDAWPTLPDPLAAHAGARNVFERAGQNGVVQLSDGQRFAAYGYPDLLRPTSKVLLTADGGRGDFVVALHRYPSAVGILGHGAPSHLPAPDSRVGPAADSRFDRTPDNPDAALFAVEPKAVYYEEDGRVHSFDGRESTVEGTPGQVGATLVLRWSQR